MTPGRCVLMGALGVVAVLGLWLALAVVLSSRVPLPEFPNTVPPASPTVSVSPPDLP